MARATLFMLLHACSLVVVSAGTSRAAIVNHYGTQVESESGYQVCLSCHDGVVAPNIVPCLSTLCPLRSDHPVNRNYPPANGADRFTPLAEATAVGIKFVDGKVDCISCHNLLNTDKYLLRVRNRNSRLCLACHIK